MSELDELLADLTLEQRAKLRQALQLLEADKANEIPQEQLDLAESAVQCHRSEFVIEDVVRQTFVNGDKLFRATPFAEEVRQQIPEVDFLELAEPRSAVTTLPSVVKWTESNFPGYVKILGSVVDDREKPLKERKVIGLIYEVAADTLQALIEKSGDLRNDHRMYLALTSFQAWHHSLYYGPCLSVFTLANVVVKGNESPGATHPFSAQLRLQFPTALYEEAMGTETLDTNVLQLADVLWFVCHGDAQKLKEMPRQEKPIDGEQMWKFSCQKFLKSLYEQQSKIVTKSEHLVVKMQRELAEVQQHFSEL